MIAVRQTLTEMPYGNSLSACIAALFEWPIWLVPHFTAQDTYRKSPSGWRRNHEGPPGWWTSLGQFAFENGWRIIQVNNTVKGGYAGQFRHGDLGIALVRQRQGGWDHSVIAELKTGIVVMDPHPEGWPEGHQLGGDEVSAWILLVALK